MRYAEMEFGAARLRDGAEPETPPGFARVRVLACGVCATDLHLLHGMVLPRGASYPVRPGHEIAGIVEQVNGDGARVKEGDLAILHPSGAVRRVRGLCPRTGPAVRFAAHPGHARCRRLCRVRRVARLAHASGKRPGADCSGAAVRRCRHRATTRSSSPRFRPAARCACSERAAWGPPRSPSPGRWTPTSAWLRLCAASRAPNACKRWASRFTGGSSARPARCGTAWDAWTR